MTFVCPCDHMEDVKTMCKWYSRNRGASFGGRKFCRENLERNGT